MCSIRGNIYIFLLKPFEFAWQNLCKGLSDILPVWKGKNKAFPSPSPPSNVVLLFELPVENNKHPNFEWREGFVDCFVLWRYHIWTKCLYSFVADCSLKRFSFSGSARVFGYTVYRGFLNRVYSILQLKYGYSVYHFLWISGIKYTYLNFGYIWMNFGYFWVFWRIFFRYTGIPLPPLADPAFWTEQYNSH